MTNDDKKWYVIYTKPRWEKKVDKLLQLKGIASFCPIITKQHQWSDRKKMVDEVLFKSYIFVCINANQQLEVLQTEGAMFFIKIAKELAVVKDEEINAIKRFLNIIEAEDANVINETEFDIDTKVIINHGVFMDNEGTIVKRNKKRVFVKIESLGQVMVVEFPVNYLIKM